MSNSTKQGISWGTYSRSPGKEIPCLLWHRSSITVFVEVPITESDEFSSQPHTLFKIHFSIIILRNCFCPSGFPTKILYAFLISAMRGTCCPSHPPWLDDFNNIWRRADITKLVIMWSAPHSCYLFSVNSRETRREKQCTRDFWKVRGLTLFRDGILWKCGDSLFFEVPPLVSDALLTTLHPLLENVLQTVDHFEISFLGAPFSWLEKPRKRMERDLNWILCSAWKKWIDGTPLEHPPYSPYLTPCDLWAFRTTKRELRGKKFGSD
jgi:hypothetical protein